MNLKEALDSGRPWRRKGDSEGLWFVDIHTAMDGVVERVTESGWRHTVYAEDIKADDYELKPAGVTITSTQFWAAATEAMKDEGPCWIGARGLEAANLRIVSGIARRLGFGGEGAE